MADIVRFKSEIQIVVVLVHRTYRFRSYLRNQGRLIVNLVLGVEESTVCVHVTKLHLAKKTM